MSEPTHMQHHEDARRVCWPPRVVLQTPLGLMRDSAGSWYPRDIGRSTVFHHGSEVCGIVFQFGDTFSHDSDNKYIGLTDNTCSIAIDPTNPTLSSYRRYYETQRKHAIEASIQPLPEDHCRQLKLWPFSGIVQTEHIPSMKLFKCLTWFEVYEVEGTNVLYKHMGIAEVFFKYDSGIRRVLTIRNAEREQRHSELFAGYQPKFGNFCAISDDGWIYLYGHRGVLNKDVCLARVVTDNAFAEGYYRFWDGTSWTRNVANCATVFSNLQHGQIFPTEMFGEHSPYKWAFVGCNAMGDSKVQMGRARALEGPWEVYALDNVSLYSLTTPFMGPGYFYCVYPHPWADDTEKTGDLTISWSEGGITGGVLMAKLRLQMEKDSDTRRGPSRNLEVQLQYSTVE